MSFCRYKLSSPGRSALLRLLATCFLSVPLLANAATKLEPVTLQLKWRHAFQFAGYYAAKEKGFYRDAGLEVTIQEHEGERSPAEKLLAGEVEYAVTASDIVLHRAQGRPILALAAIFQHSPYAFLVRADSGIRRVEELKGLRVMIGPGAQDAALRATLRNAGLEAGDFIEQQTSFDVASLINGETDAFNAYVTDQGFTLRKAGIEPRYLLPQQYGVDFYGDILATTEQEAKKHPGRLRRFRDASLKGWSYALQHPDELIDLILEKYNDQGMSRAHLEYEARTSRELIQPLLVQIGYMNPARWQHIRDTFEELGFIPPDSTIQGLVFDEPDDASDLIRWLEKYWWMLSIGLAVLFFLFMSLLLLQMKRLVRRRTAQLAESEQRYRTIFNAAPEGIWLTDKNKKTLEVNERLCAIIGYHAEEMQGRTPMEFVDEQNRQLSIEQTAKALTTERYSYEIALRHRDGRNVPTLFSSVTLRDKDQRALGSLAFVTDITEQAKLLEQIKTQKDHLYHLAHHDTLTDLPNRVLFNDRLEQAILKTHRSGGHVAVFFVDLDRFKEINDSLGHVVGDMVLEEVSERFRHCIREDDTIARLGGDEFTFIMEALGDPQNAAVLARKLIQSLEQPFHIAGHQFYITASVGISLYPQDGANAQTLLRNADSAMYRSKELGRNTFHFYTEDMTEKALQRVSMEASMRRALEREEFVLYYQPQINLGSGAIIGVEALVRWQHPDMGLVQPGLFIPLAEDTGLINPLGEWILRTACGQIKAWHELDLPVGRVAVNISGRQLQNRKLAGSVLSALEETGCRPEWLELEITESFIMQHPQEAVAILRDIRGTGIDLAIDDFGTGHSSLSYLKQLPATKLKIDRSFVRDIPDDPEDMAITRAVMALGASLNLHVVAEGVETETQHAFLCNEGCEAAQGFLFSRPIPADEMTEMLAERQLQQQHVS